MAYISKVTLPNSGGTYDIKDASAWSAISDLWSVINQGALELVVLGASENLPTASTDTMGKIYLKPDTTHDPSVNDVYDEYVTVDKGSSANPRYVWEKIGNTDVNLSQYSLKTHTHTVDINIGVNSHSYTPGGTVSRPTFSGTSFNSSGSYTPAGSVTTNATENKTATVSAAASGTATYTPGGTVSQPTFSGTEGTVSVSGTVTGGTGSGSAASSGAHTHSMAGTTKYLHSVNVPTAFGTTAVLQGVNTSKLKTTTITGTNGTLVTHDTPTLNRTSYGSASSWSSGTASTWAFNVASGTETLTISGGNSTKPSLTITNVSVGTSLTAGTEQTVAKAASSATTVATGDVSTGGTGAVVAVSAGSTANAYTSISSSTASFTLNSTASGGSAVITAVNSATGSSGAHTHSVSIDVGDITIQSTGSFTPTGTVSQPTFSGTGVRLVTGNIAVPKTYTFSGTAATITVSGTATGTVSQPTFSGTAATLSHTVTGNGTKTTSQASA